MNREIGPARPVTGRLHPGWLLLASLLPAALGALELGGQLAEGERPLLFAGLGVYVALFVLAYALTGWLDRGTPTDPLILPLIAFLSGAGLVELYRLSPALAQRQLGWVALSVAAWVLLGRWSGWSGLRRVWPLWGVLAAALSWVTRLFGTTVGGAKAWLTIGGWQFQPVELTKLLIILFVAGLLSARPTSEGGQSSRGWRRRWGWVLAALIWALTIVGVILQSDLGGALLLVGVSMVLLASERRSRPLLLPLLVGGVVVAALAYARIPYVRVRFDSWLFPFADPHGTGYQAVQALYALGSGSLFGTGLGQGLPSRIPVAGSDYLLAAWGEEVGFLGVVPVLLAVCLLALRAVAAGRQQSAQAVSGRTQTMFTGLVLAGIGGLFGLQAFLIAGGIARVVPLTGVPFPWMSYGGSSVLMSGVAASLVTAATRRRAGEGRNGREPGSDGPDTDISLTSALPSASFFRVLGRVLLAGSVILVAAFSYWQIVQGDSLAQSAQNPRVLLRALGVARGGIYDRHDRALAEPIHPAQSAARERQAYRFLTRHYSVDSSFGPVMGYLDPQVGVAGLEASWSDWLTRGATGPVQWLDRAMGRAPAGPGTLYLTLDASVQSLAGRLLRGRAGAAVVMDVQSGELLAVASSPGFDPGTVGARWEELRDQPDHPLFSRAVEGQYAPGSVWKPLVLAAALESGIVAPDTTFVDGGRVSIDGNVIQNAGGETYGSLNLSQALAVSSNVVFAQLGAKLPPESWRRYLQPLVEWKLVTPDRRALPVRAGAFAGADLSSPVARAEMGIGQGPLGLSPLALAVGIGALANGGVAVTPRLIQEGVGPAGEALALPEGRSVRLFSAEVAHFVTQAMEQVVSSGTGRLAALPGVTVAGKTGTAQTPRGREDAWFAGFAPAEAPRVVAVVVIEGGGAGGRTAAPVARQLIEAALGAVGDSPGDRGRRGVAAQAAGSVGLVGMDGR